VPGVEDDACSRRSREAVLKASIVAGAAGKPQRTGSHYQLVGLCLLLLASQYEFFVYPSLPFAYVAIVLGQWIVDVLNHAPLVAPSFTQASASDVFKYTCIIGAEWLQLACVWFVTRSGFRPFDFIGIAQRKQWCLDVCFGIGLVAAEAIYTVLLPLLRTLHTSPHVHLVNPLSCDFILLIGVSVSAGFVEEIVLGLPLRNLQPQARIAILCINGISAIARHKRVTGDRSGVRAEHFLCAFSN
jgi:hypothetical protein